MTTLMSKLFHPKREKETDFEIVSEWPPASEGTCDLCNAEIDDGHLIPAEVFKKVVDEGFNPYADSASKSKFGSSDAYRSWRTFVERDSTDWCLCGECAVGVARFLRRTS